MAHRDANHFRFFDQTGFAAGVNLFSEPVNLGRIPVCAHWIGMHANFTYAGADGGQLDVFLQTSLDYGLTWCDIANIHFLQASARRFTGCSSTITLGVATWNPGYLTIADNTVLQGLIGDYIRVAVAPVNAYATSRLVVDVVIR